MVGILIIARGLDLDVLAQHVESRLLEEDEVAFHRLLGRRRVEPVGPPALIERAVLEDGFVVEQDRGLTLHLARPDRNLAHCEIGVDAVTRGASDRSEERRVGKEGVGKCSCPWYAFSSKKNKKQSTQT